MAYCLAKVRSFQELSYIGMQTLTRIELLTLKVIQISLSYKSYQLLHCSRNNMQGATGVTRALIIVSNIHGECQSTEPLCGGLLCAFIGRQVSIMSSLVYDFHVTRVTEEQSSTSPGFNVVIIRG